MKKMGWILFMVFLVGCFYNPVLAGDLPRLMMMGEDEDRDTIPRGHRVHKRVMNTFANALINEGFDVYEERAKLDDVGSRGRRTLEHLIDNAKDAGADVIGANCGSLDPTQIAVVIFELKKTTSLPLLAQPNAGKPKLVENKTIFEMAPEPFAQGIKDCIIAGAKIVGGCCGTTPEHIQAVKELIKRIN